MKYKALYNSRDFLEGQKDLLDILLKNRGVEDTEALLNVNANDVLDGIDMKNMYEALTIFNSYIQRAKKEEIIIHVIIDQDFDGYSASAYLIRYLKKLKEKYNLKLTITYTMHEKKVHGIKLEELENIKFDLLIVPDAGTNDVDECKNLKENNPNLDIIILDHHNIEQENPYAIVVNCQDNIYGNNTLAGVGVTYKFCKEYDIASDNNFADLDLDLVAFGNIADMMDMRNLETRYITLEGLKNVTNPFLKEIIDKNSFSIGDELNITKVGWYVSPLINAVTRVGTLDEKLDTFKALLGENETKEYQPRRKKKTDEKPPVEIQSIQQFMARECGNIKNRQDKIAKQGMEELSVIIEENGYNNDKIIIVEATDVLEKDFTGLIANKLCSKYKRPVIILKSFNEDTFGGSGRNCKLSPIPDLNAFLTSLNLFDEVSGHDNSFGFKIKKDKVEILRQTINEQLKGVIMEDVYIVDYEIPVGRLKPNQVERVGKWRNIWGNVLNEPLFAITDIYINVEDVKLLGDKKNIIKIENKGLTFLFKFANEDMYNRIIHRNAKGLNTKSNKRLKLTIIGKFTLNKWNDCITPQIEVVDFESVEQTRARF